jgi:hypothetical protein
MVGRGLHDRVVDGARGGITFQIHESKQRRCLLHSQAAERTAGDMCHGDVDSTLDSFSKLEAAAATVPN